MLHRQKIWVPIAEHNPLFKQGLEDFLYNNPMSTFVASTLQLRQENMFVAVAPDARKPSRKVARLLAVPFRITPQACDDQSDSAKARPFSSGFASNVSDSLNSLQVMERLLPFMPIHVSICLQMQQLSKQSLLEGDDIVIISNIEKIGKRIAYCKTDIYLDKPSSYLASSPKLLAKERDLRSVEELQNFIDQYYLKVMSGSHVKSILEKKKEYPEPQKGSSQVNVSE